MVVPTITSIFPDSGVTAGGTPAQIVGTDFTGTTGVTIDGNAVTMFAEVDDSNILIITPAGTIGKGDVVLTTGGGADTLTDGFNYLAGTMSTQAEVARKAGAFASSTSTAEAYTNVYILQAESYVNVKTRKNWTAIYDSLDAAVKYILEETVSNLAAIYSILYNTQSFTILEESEDLINVMWAKAESNIEILKDPDIQTFMIEA